MNVSWNDATEFCDVAQLGRKGRTIGCRWRPSGNKRVPAQAALRGIVLGTDACAAWASTGRGSDVNSYAVRRIPWARRNPTPGGFTTCTETCGSGVATGSPTTTTRTLRRPTQQVLRRDRIAWTEAVAGSGDARYCRSADRDWHLPGRWRGYDLGFRVSLVPSGQANFLPKGVRSCCSSTGQ